MISGWQTVGSERWFDSEGRMIFEQVVTKPNDMVLWAECLSEPNEFQVESIERWFYEDDLEGRIS